jgi:uncharacterized membrane protein
LGFNLRKALKISLIAVFAALTMVLTLTIQIYIPATKGYFNIGEAMVYLSAILLGPYLGGFAGGLGSSLADVVSGYYYFAPGTFIIKSVEGFTVGLIYMKLKSLSKFSHRAAVFTFSIIPSVVFLVASLIYYGDLLEVSFNSLGFGAIQPLSTLSLSFPWYAWITLSVAIFLVLLYVGFNVEPLTWIIVFSCLSGGSLMVLGYFLYEFYILGYGWVSIAEVPFNIAQVIVGLSIAVILSKPLIRALKVG